MGECLYTQFWKEQMPFIKEAISLGKSKQKAIEVKALQSCSREGDRKTLRFRITMEGGVATTKTNSAIARDLISVIDLDPEIPTISAGKSVVINLLNGDTLNISVN